MPRVTYPLSIASLSLVAGACQGELDATLDMLPQRYPNRLDAADTSVTALVYSPSGAFTIPSHARAIARPAASRSGPSDEHASDEVGDEVGDEVVGDVAFRDVDGDGQRDAIARFDVGDLRAAGLLSSQHGVEVRIEGQNLTWTGRDRLFDVGASLIVLPEPSGPNAVGTASLLLHDAARPGPGDEGRALLVRLWYPAAPSDRQPAPYFLDARRAELNLRASPLPLPPDLFERTHGFAHAHAAPAAAEARPAVIVSTAWSAPVEMYSALAEDLASHGYLVLGVNHPNGAGALVYPDGSGPGLDPALVSPDESNNLDWALDIEHVAEWLVQTPALEAARASVELADGPDVRAALTQLDPSRIAALGHSFGGSAAVRADAESELIEASANLDGAFVGDATHFGERARALVLLSPQHPAFDSSIDDFFSAAGADCRALTIAGTGHANFGDTGWLYWNVLADYPDLTAEGYQLGAIPRARAHVIVTTYLRAFFDAAFDGVVPPLLDSPSAAFPEVVFR
jgi:dienelactone hydrolase